MMFFCFYCKKFILPNEPYTILKRGDFQERFHKACISDFLISKPKEKQEVLK